MLIQNIVFDFQIYASYCRHLPFNFPACYLILVCNGANFSSFLQAMFEGILVDIPFATFFLSKLKQKYESNLLILFIPLICMYYC